MDNKMIPIFHDDREALVKIVTAQQEQNGVMQRQLTEMGKMMLVFDQKNRELGRLIESRLTITGAQARGLQAAIVSRARALCERNRVSYADKGDKVRAAIRGAVKAEFDVYDLCDIPAARYEAARELIVDWSSFELFKRLR